MSEASINPATVEFLKKEKAKRSRQRKIMMIVAPLLVAGIATAGYFGISSYRANSQAQAAKEFVATNMSKGPSMQGFEAMRKAVDSGQFSWEQMREAGREAWEKAEKERMNAYFGTPTKDRDKYLDKLLDEMQKMRAQMEAARAKMGPTTRPNWGDRQREGPTTRPGGERRDRGPGGGNRADSMSPVDRAMNQEFRAALERRAKERGIELRGPGFGRGGPGGGRGGGGGGGGGGR